MATKTKTDRQMFHALRSIEAAAYNTQAKAAAEALNGVTLIADIAAKAVGSATDRTKFRSGGKKESIQG